MFLAVIIVCSTMQAQSCYPMVNNSRVFYSHDECYQDADMVAQAVINSGRVYSTSPYCVPLAFGEPV